MVVSFFNIFRWDFSIITTISWGTMHVDKELGVILKLDVEVIFSGFIWFEDSFRIRRFLFKFNFWFSIIFRIARIFFLFNLNIWFFLSLHEIHEESKSTFMSKFKIFVIIFRIWVRLIELLFSLNEIIKEINFGFMPHTFLRWN